MARTTSKTLDQLARIASSFIGQTVAIEHAYGQPRAVIRYPDTSERELSPRLPTGQLADWLRAFNAGAYASKSYLIAQSLTAGHRDNPRPRRTKRLMRKKRHYEFFRAGSIAGMDKPAEGAARAKQLADAIEWAFKQGVEYRYYYGRDADPEATSEWDGLIVAVHPKGNEGQAYGYLGNDYSQRHVEAEAALDLKLSMRK